MTRRCIAWVFDAFLIAILIWVLWWILVMFGVLVATRSITPNPFFKKRKKKLED